ncbi:MAG TPA: DSD1 family PLP-dependent enzyme [Planctomycetaceae bacterium]|nr:DSD1 family PLP-dependent enzyme [Planctomycetaceae bacterium]
MVGPYGLTKAELDTPLLCVDLDAFERNLRFMSQTVLAGGKTWRPHSKGHKSPAVAWRQIRAGAIGVTCAKVSEAEVMAQAGVRDILIANVIAGSHKVERLASLCSAADPIICCDHFAQAEPIAAACRRRGVTCRVLVDINIGMNRTGCRPGMDAVDLGEAITKLEGLELVGIMGYEGHLLRIADPAEKEQQIRGALDVLGHCREMFHRQGLRCDIVSAGGTGSVTITSQSPSITEVQSGGGIFGDPFYREACQVEPITPALTVLSTVTSRPSLERAVLDAGRKTLNPELGFPKVAGHADAVVASMSAEHCTLSLGPQSQDLKIGDQVELVVGYHDWTTVLHDQFVTFRNDRAEGVWPILGRGKLQ